MRAFYQGIFGLEVVMDQEWIVTFSAETMSPAQVSLASEGGSGTQVPDLSIEVDDVDDIYMKAKQANCEIVYELANEGWGVRRFFARDPAGHTLNIMSHKV